LVDTAEPISISEADAIGISVLARDAAAGRDRIVVQDDKPIATIIGIERLERIHQLEDDLTDIAIVTARVLTESGEPVSLDDVLTRFGYTREQLSALPEC
jgi:hypothetical protein